MNMMWESILAQVEFDNGIEEQVNSKLKDKGYIWHSSMALQTENFRNLRLNS